MTSRFVDWIWHIRGSLPLRPGQSGDEALDRLTPLFGEVGTAHQRTGDRITFRKKDQASQDRMAVFDGGVLHINRDPRGPVLRYNLASRTLLFCFLAPLLFLGFAQLSIALADHDRRVEAAAKSAKPVEKPKAKTPVPLNPIDKFLGAPEPEKPKKKGAEEENRKKPSTTPAYVFAIMFACLYVIGRFLEERLVRSLFRNSLLA